MRMTERTSVTEGLGSAMLSIWLRDVLCLWTGLQEHKDYTICTKLGKHSR